MQPRTLLDRPEAGAARCAALLHRVESGLLDCLSDDLALLLAHAGCEDVLSPFGQDWRFELVASSAGPPALDLPPADLDDRLARRTGLRPRWREHAGLAAAAPAWRASLAEGRPLVVVGDAFWLPWLPYAGHEHMEHGFVVDALDGQTAEVVDPYRNVTRWGGAEPIACRLPLADLAPALGSRVRWATLERAGAPAAPDPAGTLAANALAVLAAEAAGAFDRFLDGHAGSDAAVLQHLSLQTWLLARSRALHGAWLGTLAGRLPAPGLNGWAEAFPVVVAGAWRRAAESAYVALRRVQAGRAAPPGTLDAAAAACRAEAAAARRLAEAAVAAAPEGRR